MLKNKVIIITGSSSGLGQAIAAHLATKSVKGLVITGRNAEGVAKTKELCLAAKGFEEGKITEVIGDITADGTQEELINAAVDNYGKLDVLINNAGSGGKMGTVATGSMEEYDSVMELNVRSVISLTKLAIPHLITSKGNVINISSAISLRPLASASFYGMSKAALDFFTKTLALELGSKGVRVNSVNPGFVAATGFHEAVGVPKEAMDAVTQRMSMMSAVQRSGKPVEVAKSVAFLASEQASFTTGSILTVDGGFYLSPTQPAAAVEEEKME